jgi:exodeoxyribonuclease VII large subunit
LVGGARQRLDDRAARLAMALPNLLAARRAALVRSERGMPAPQALIEARRARLTLAAAHLRGGLRHLVQTRHAAGARSMVRLTPAPLTAMIREARAHLGGLSARLESVSYEAVLARGFALVFDGAGHALTRAEAVKSGARLRLRFADGEVAARAEPAPPAVRQGRLDL